MEGNFFLTLPEELTLFRGRVAELHLSVRREGMLTPVDIRVEDLPDGVTASGGHLRTVQVAGRCSLAAASDARIVAGHPVTIVATSAEGREVSRTFRLTVTDAVALPGTGAAEASRPENLRREAGRASDRRSRRPGWPPKRPKVG